MASGDVQVQTTVHSVDQGRISKFIKVGMVTALLIGLSLLYLFVQFRGLNSPNAMDQAQIARNLAMGEGFSTRFIRPVAISILKARSGQKDAIDLDNFPDFYQSPLSPWVNSFSLRLIRDHLDMTPTELLYAGDRQIAVTSIVLLLLSVVGWYFVISRLMDEKLAVLACLAVLLTDLLWRFSLSGLPQMLVLFLFSLASLATVFAMEAREKELVPLMLGWLAVAALLFGLMTLAHGLCVWIFLGWLVFAVIYFSPRLLTLFGVLAAFLLVVTPWMVRNHQVCGNPFGLAVYDAFYDGTPEQTYERQTSVSFRSSGISIPGKVRASFLDQANNLVGLLGVNVVVMAFFLALVHPFRSHKASVFKWGVLLMWLGAVAGMCFYHTDGVISANQLHVLFIPLFASFGMAFLLVLWNRLDWGGHLMRIAFIILILAISAVPMALTLLSPPQYRLQWPPYAPPIIGIFSDWFQKNEVICSDMPWAVAWYAQRISLLMPDTVRNFNRLHDYAETKQTISGLYLTPLSGSQKLFPEIYKGPHQEWAPLITRPPRLDNFPFTAFVLLPFEGESIIFADRNRWDQPVKRKPNE